MKFMLEIGLLFITGLTFVKKNYYSKKEGFLPHQTSILLDTLTVHSLGI